MSQNTPSDITVKVKEPDERFMAVKISGALGVGVDVNDLPDGGSRVTMLLSLQTGNTPED